MAALARRADQAVTIVQTTPDLSASFTNHGEPITIEVDLPGDQHFLRIRALGPQ